MKYMDRFTNTRMSLKWPLPVLIALLVFMAVPGFAQEAKMGAGTAGNVKQKDGNFKFYVETEMAYSDNVFGLTEEQQSAMDSNDPVYVQNGRFKDMASVSDYIVKPRIGLRYDAESPWGGKMRVTSWIRYNYYTKNEEASYPEGRIRFSQSIGENGTLNVEGNFLLGCFKKNYLSGYDDANANGNVTREERSYSQATYDEYEGMVSYEHEIIDDKDKMISGLELRPYAGVRYRKFNAVFDNRNLDVLFGGIGVDLEFLSSIGLELIYKYERISAPNDHELILYDEEAAGTDVSGDGRIKANAPLATRIDRSADRHTIEIIPSIKLTKDASVYMEYSKRVATNTSDNPLDLDHCHTREYRERIKAGIKYNFSKRWSAQAEYKHQDEEEEDGDSSEKGYLLSLRYNF